MTASAFRRGFTLVELLVVVGLMASLLGLLVTGLRPNGSTQIRQLSQNLSSAILAARTRSIGTESGYAIVLEPGGGVPDIASNSIFFAGVPPFITGTTGTSGMPPVTLSVTSTTVTLFPLNADVLDLASGYKVRFQRSSSPILPPSPWFAFAPAAGGSGTVSFRGTQSQTSANTVWPVGSGSNPLQFAVARRPVKSDSTAESTKFAAIDLRYSGVGNTIAGDYGTLHGKGSIAIVFDQDGGFDSVMTAGTSLMPLVPSAPLYLLIASVPDIEQNRSLQSESSRWLAIAPATGRVTVATTVVVSGTTEGDIMAARANARQGAAGGAR